MYEYSRWYIGSSSSKFGNDIGSHIVIAINMVDLQSRKLVLEFPDFCHVYIHCFLVDVPFFVYLLDDK